MPTIDQSRPILDSAGRPANGYLRIRMSHSFDATPGFVTSAVAVADVRNGRATSHGNPLFLPVTPNGVWAQIDEDFDGSTVTSRTVVVPSIEEIAYADLILNYPAQGGPIDGGTVGGSGTGLIDGGMP